MSKLKLLVLSTAVICASVAAVAQSSNMPELPPGAMQSKAQVGCTTCHDAHILVQQRLSKAAWGKEVDKMIKWGAIVSASDRDALVDYFSTNFGPDKPAYEAQRSSTKPSK
jgi:hypothetical protein